MKNNFPVRDQTRASSPTVDSESTEFTPSPKQMQGITGTSSMSAAGWTDEKHNMYLKSMEASFVNQLYDSKKMLGCFSRKQTSSGPATTSSQFKVLRGGCWQNINFERENPRRSGTKECLDLKASPWVRHFRSSSKQASVAAPALEESDTSTSQVVVDSGQRKRISAGSAIGSGQLSVRKSHVLHQHLLYSDAEMSDQNFVDEEVEEEKENNRRNVKRLKSLIMDATGNDQIVPIRKSSTTRYVTKNCVSPA